MEAAVTYALVGEAYKGLNRKPEEENNMGLLLLVFDSLNNLYEKLNRLNYVIQQRNIGQILYLKGKEKQNEN